MEINRSNLVKTYVHTVYATVRNVIFEISAGGLVLSRMPPIALKFRPNVYLLVGSSTMYTYEEEPSLSRLKMRLPTKE